MSDYFSSTDSTVPQESAKKVEALSRVVNVLTGSNSKDNWDEALRQCQDILKEGPNETASLQLVKVYQRLGQMDDAMKHLQGLTRKSPAVYSKIAELYSSSGKSGEGAAYFKKEIANIRKALTEQTSNCTQLNSDGAPSNASSSATTTGSNVNPAATEGLIDVTEHLEPHEQRLSQEARAARLARLESGLKCCENMLNILATGMRILAEHGRDSQPLDLTPPEHIAISGGEIRHTLFANQAYRPSPTTAQYVDSTSDSIATEARNACVPSARTPIGQMERHSRQERETNKKERKGILGRRPVMKGL